MTRYNAILLIGPTGSGKTPLGQACQERGLWGRRCWHFDFGEQLRRTALLPPTDSPLTPAEAQVVAHSLATGALLEDEHFTIAHKILSAFAAARAMGPDDVLVLNGLPRHEGQAADVDALVRVRMVVYLECSSQTVRDRIRLNTGGDRDGRCDDSLPEIERKLALFHGRTLALVRHYERRGAMIETIPVQVATTPEDIRGRLESASPLL